MKRLLPISLVVNALLIIVAAMYIFGPVVGNTFSTVNSELPGLSGSGASAPEFQGLYEPSAAPGAMPPAVDQAESKAVSGAPAAAVERIVIKNADLAIVVSDVEGRMKDIQVMAQQMGGFVVSSNLYQSYTNNSVKVPEAQVVIRVPSEKLTEAMDQIKKDVVEVQNENISGQDVTSEYVDLKSRLKNLEDAEAQMDSILQKATDTADVVNIFNQLVAYREQIEVIKGKIKYYDEAASLSAISVRIIAEETVQPLVIGKWEPKGIALAAIQDLIDFLKGFAKFAIRFVVYILPSWIIVGIPLYLIFIGARKLYYKVRSRKVKQEQQQEDIEKK
jgi:hypothetical protein